MSSTKAIYSYNKEFIREKIKILSPHMGCGISRQISLIGFISLNPDSHWASTAHLPAFKPLTDKFTIVGVANRTPESSRRSADALGLLK